MGHPAHIHMLPAGGVERLQPAGPARAANPEWPARPVRFALPVWAARHVWLAIPVWAVALAALLTASPVAPPAAASAVEVDPTFFFLRPGTTRYMRIGDPSCDFEQVGIRVDGGNVSVSAYDQNGVLLDADTDGDGQIIIPKTNPVIFSFEATANISSLSFVSTEICWSHAAPCTDTYCEGFPGTGFFLSSQFYPDPKTYEGMPGAADHLDPVNTANGELFLPPWTLLDLNGVLPLDFSIYYANGIRTDNNFVSRLGSAWSHSLDWQLDLVEFTEDVVEIYPPSGAVIRFEPDFYGGEWVLRPYTDVGYQLVKDGADFVLADPRDGRLYRFNATGKLIEIADGRGNALAVTYDGNNRVSQVTDGLGRTLTFTYVSNRLDQVSDGTRTVSFGYASGLLTSVTDALGGVTTYTYDANTVAALITSTTFPRGNVQYTQVFDSDERRVLSQTDANGNTTTLAYDDLAGERTITDPLGDTTVHTYSETGELTGLQDPAGQGGSVAYDEHGRRIQITDRRGNTTFFTYHEPSGRLASVVDPNGGMTTFDYASRDVALGGSTVTFHDLVGITRADGSSLAFTYDAAGNLTSWTDPGGNTRSYSYNARGQILTETSPAGGTSSYTYNADGTIASFSDAFGNTSTIDYDALRRPIRTTRPDGSTIEAQYDALDRVVSRTDELGNVASYTYDANGNLASVTSPLGNVTSFAYDDMDRLVTMTDPLGGTITATYDALGRRQSVTDENGTTVSVTYDAAGRMSGVVDPAGKTWPMRFDVEGAPASSSNPLGETISFSVNSMGWTSSTQSPLGNTSSTGYDAMGRVTELGDPIGWSVSLAHDTRGLITGMTLELPAISASYTHNSIGALTSATDPRGNVWTQSVDLDGRPTARMDPLGNERAMTYDARRRRSQISLAGMGTLTYSYDDAGRVIGEDYSDGTSRAYTYDADGRLTSATAMPGAVVSSFAYDAAGRMADCNGLSMTRDAGGRLTSLTLAPGKTVTYAYDPRNLVTEISDWVGGVTAFTYDDAGRLTSLSRPNGIVTNVAYDADGRLIAVEDAGISTVTVTRNARGDVVTSSRDASAAVFPELDDVAFTFDAASQPEDIMHDALGCPTTGGARTYAWNLSTQLESYDEGGNVVSFTYDVFHNVASRTEGGVAARGGGGVTERYVWNHALAMPSISVVRDGAGTDVRYYIHSPDGGLLHSVEAADDTRRFHHADHTGSIAFLSDDGGAVTDAYTYGPFGRLLAHTGTTENPFTFHGGWGVMSEGDLYRMRARLYDPARGRFLTRDRNEVVGPKGLNPYQAFFGNPVRYVDPSGANPDAVSSQWHLISNSPELSKFGLYFMEVALLDRLVSGGSSRGAAPPGGGGASALSTTSASEPGETMPWAGGFEVRSAPADLWVADLNGAEAISPAELVTLALLGFPALPGHAGDMIRKLFPDANAPGATSCCSDKTVAEIIDDAVDATSPANIGWRLWFVTGRGSRWGTKLGSLLLVYPAIKFERFWAAVDARRAMLAGGCKVRTPSDKGCMRPLFHPGPHIHRPFRGGRAITWPQAPTDEQFFRDAYEDYYDYLDHPSWPLPDIVPEPFAK